MVWRDLDYLICLRHLLRLRAVTLLNYFHLRPISFHMLRNMFWVTSLYKFYGYAPAAFISSRFSLSFLSTLFKWVLLLVSVMNKTISLWYHLVLVTSRPRVLSQKVEHCFWYRFQVYSMVFLRMLKQCLL